MGVAYYTTASGRKPVVDYIKRQAKWEIKIMRNLSHRIFYVVVVKDEIVLLHA